MLYNARGAAQLYRLHGCRVAYTASESSDNMICANEYWRTQCHTPSFQSCMRSLESCQPYQLPITTPQDIFPKCKGCASIKHPCQQLKQEERFTAEILRILLWQNSGWVPRKGCSHGSRWKQPAPQLGWASLDTDAMENNSLWTVDSTTLPQSQSAVYTSKKFSTNTNSDQGSTKFSKFHKLRKVHICRPSCQKQNLPLSLNYSVLLWVLIKEAVWRILSSDSYRTLLQGIMQYTHKLLDSS